MKPYTADQLIEIIDRSLKETAEAVQNGRIPLDGRARMPLPAKGKGPAIKPEPPVPDAAE